MTLKVTSHMLGTGAKAKRKWKVISILRKKNHIIRIKIMSFFYDDWIYITMKQNSFSWNVHLFQILVEYIFFFLFGNKLHFKQYFNSQTYLHAFQGMSVLWVTNITSHLKNYCNKYWWAENAHDLIFFLLVWPLFTNYKS